MIRKQDNLWKGALEDNFPDFIRFIDSDADRILDLNKGVQFLDKELQQKIRSLLNFIRFYIRFESNETKAEFDKELEILIKHKNTMGLEEQIMEMIREEGKEEGKKEGKKEGAKKIKEKLVGDLIHDSRYTDQQIMKLIQVPLKLVRDIRKKRAALFSEDKPIYQVKRSGHKLLSDKTSLS